jgi:LysM repeat protein
MSGQQQTRRPETAPQEETPSGGGGLLGTLTNWVSQLGATAGNAAAAAAITPQTAPTVHTVARGDTLGAIAKKYGTTTAALQQANNIRDPSRIAIGQKITIPKAQAPKATPPVNKPPANKRRVSRRPRASRPPPARSP